MAGVFLLVGVLSAIQAFCIWSLLCRYYRRIRYKKTKYTIGRAIALHADPLKDPPLSPSMRPDSIENINLGSMRHTLIEDENVNRSEPPSPWLFHHQQQYGSSGLPGIGAGHCYTGSDPSRPSLTYPANVGERFVQSTVLPAPPPPLIPEKNHDTVVGDHEASLSRSGGTCGIHPNSLLH